MPITIQNLGQSMNLSLPTHLAQLAPAKNRKVFDRNKAYIFLYYSGVLEQIGLKGLNIKKIDTMKSSNSEKQECDENLNEMYIIEVRV